MTSEKVVLFDLPSKPPVTGWSPNAWKARFALKFKGVDYHTEWLEFPEIKPRLEPHVPANKEGWQYTIPTLLLPDGTYVMDNQNIAEYLEQTYPEPSLQLDSPYLFKIEALRTKLFEAILPALGSEVSRRILNPPSAEYWDATRSQPFGTSLDILAKERGEEAWNESEAVLKNITELLSENSDGPFFAGQTVGYADFVWAGVLLFMQKLGEDAAAEGLKRTGDPQVHLALLQALSPWMQDNDR
ncbi:hypothetical protein ASPWEDRAFT_46676 [Aspergillus wentii DTO 134E9]|uniref:GST N-terminal domain-containing protein n=1 Tax=Aspergillus wentii DTO 134E9 TaxID=1073089 RepID=A0A1L9R4U0_ASPWE|nr:uncharacterized protein ASPWEDRAFT_46676 [Aspergillus wentii DTO 134E9]KAI9927203.1 hypothetical protein MW887_003587 [Aspergillus wentii]OJJ29929.1 hypothetical protein ASPWEDRAFT_46676 [Aspergillus wentii DTO 134E9]